MLELISWELISWEVDFVRIDLSRVDFVGVDSMRIDLVARNQKFVDNSHCCVTLMAMFLIRNCFIWRAVT